MGVNKQIATHFKPAPVVNNYIEIPKELMAIHSAVELCKNIMFISGLDLLTMVTKNNKYCTIK